MTEDEFWEVVNGGGRTYSYDDRVDFYCAYTAHGYEAALIETQDIQVYEDYQALLNLFMVAGKPLKECLDKLDY